MIIEIKPLPDNVIGFAATDTVTAADFKHTVFPAIETFMKGRDELNYLLSLDTGLAHFTAGSWLQDILLGIKNLAKWNRAAILAEAKGIKIFTDIFSKVMPGEFRVYPHAEMKEAVKWLANGEE